MHPRFSGENLEKNKLLYARFATLAAKHACSPPQLALAWLLHQGDDVIPIPGILGFLVLYSHTHTYTIEFFMQLLVHINQ